MFTFQELVEAKKSIESILHKCQKSILKLKENSAQHTLMVRRIQAFEIALRLIEQDITEANLN